MLSALWSLSIVMAFLHQLSLGLVCYLRLGILLGGGILFWSISIPMVSAGVSKLKSQKWPQFKKVGLLALFGILVLGFNQLLIDQLIGGMLQFFFDCNDLLSGSLISPIQNNVLANSVIFGVIAFVSWKLPTNPVDKLDYFFVKNGNRESRIYVKNIIWVESDRNCIAIRTNFDKHVTYSSLKSFSKSYLDGAFIQVHRSIIVKKDCILQVRKNKAGDGLLILSNGDSVKFSRNYRDNIQL